MNAKTKCKTTSAQRNRWITVREGYWVPNGMAVLRYKHWKNMKYARIQILTSAHNKYAEVE